MMKTLIFDWDGTIHDTLHLYGIAFRTAYDWLVSEGYADERVYTDEEVSEYIGMSSPDMWNKFMPNLPQEIKDKAGAIIGTSMIDSIEAGKAVLFSGAEDTLTKLKSQGYQMVILSNCKHAYMEAHKEAFSLEQWFDDFYCGEDFGYAPKEEIFTHISRKYPAPFAVIGDRGSDLKVAEVHNLASVWCAYGFGNSVECQSASETANSITEIPELINKLSE